MNKIILLGRLTRDPEVRYTSTGKVVCQFTLAVDRPFANQEGQREADFIPVVIWGKQGETCGNYLTKGQRALIEGRLQIRSYDGKDGNKRWVTEVIADRFEFIESKKDFAGAQHNNAGATRAMLRQLPDRNSLARLQETWNHSATRFPLMRKFHSNLREVMQ